MDSEFLIYRLCRLLLQRFDHLLHFRIRNLELVGLRFLAAREAQRTASAMARIVFPIFLFSIAFALHSFSCHDAVTHFV